MASQLRIAVSGDDLTDEMRSDIAQELRAWIAECVPETRVEVPVSGPPRPGQKGVDVAVGVIAAFITTGTAKALLDCIATYLRERRRTVKLEVSGAGGVGVTLTADTVGKAALEKLVVQVGTVA